MFLTHSAKQVDNQIKSIKSSDALAKEGIFVINPLWHAHRRATGTREKVGGIRLPELVADRIITFAEIVDQENVIAGTDCGLGGRAHPQIAWAKLRALRDGAALASKKLWS